MKEKKNLREKQKEIYTISLQFKLIFLHLLLLQSSSGYKGELKKYVN